MKSAKKTAVGIFPCLFPIDFNMENIPVRQAVLSDCIPLRELAAFAFRNTYAWYNTVEDMDQYVNNYFSEEKISEELADPKIKYLLACSGDEITGYAKLSLQPEELKTCSERPLEIARLYTKPELIGKGIGKRLVAESVDFAQKNNFDSLCLSAWQKNEKAVAFYKREGFEIAGTTQFILGRDVQDDFIMVKRLSSI